MTDPVAPTALLSLVQWLSPAFPTGAFAYSHGLEQAIAAGEVRTEADLSVWLSDILAHGTGWSDAVLLACGLRGEDRGGENQGDADLGALDDLARALAPSAERLRETLEQGAAFARARAAMTGEGGDAMTLPIALAASARGLGLPPAQVIGLYLHGFASNLTSAAVRFVPLGQAQGQRVLAGLHAQIADIAARAAQAGPDDITQSAFRADIGAMLHETMDVRIFKT